MGVTGNQNERPPFWGSPKNRHPILFPGNNMEVQLVFLSHPRRRVSAMDAFNHFTGVFSFFCCRRGSIRLYPPFSGCMDSQKDHRLFEVRTRHIESHSLWFRFPFESLKPKRVFDFEGSLFSMFKLTQGKRNRCVLVPT